MPENLTPFYAPGALTKRQRYETLRNELWTERTTHEPHWRDLGDFVKPRRPRFLIGDRNRGDRRNQKIIDSSAAFAARIMQSGMHAGLSSPARPWMKLTTPDPDLAEFGAVKEWLNVVTRRMLTVFQTTNLYNVLPTTYGDMGTFATAAMGVLEDDEELFRCFSYPIGSYAVGVNARGTVDQFVREWQMTVIEVVEMFLLDKRTNMIDWTNASKTIRNLWDKANYNAKVDVCWLVFPNMQRDESKIGGKYLPYYSAHVEKGQEKDDTFLRESGFNEFPVLVPRWDVTGEDSWGTDCPAMIALGDIKQLQTGEKRGMQALEKMLNPPLQGPTHIRNQKASLLPGDITYIDMREGQKGLHPIHETTVAFDKLEMKQESVRQRIRRAFYEDLFLMLAASDRREITAREVDERHEEKLLALGPVIERSNDELHDPLVDRVYAMMDRAGLIPEPPEELMKVKLKVEYTSLMAQAQKLVGVVGHERFLTVASQLVQIFPEARHKVNVMQAIDDEAEMLGVNPKVVRSDDDAEARANAEQQAIAAQQQAEAMSKMTGAAKNLSQTDLESDNAMSRLMDTAGA